jgi:hypothetical protein
VPSIAAGTFAQTGTAGASGGVVSGVLTTAVIVGVVSGKVPSDEVSESAPEQPATETTPIKSAIGIRFTPRTYAPLPRCVRGQRHLDGDTTSSLVDVAIRDWHSDTERTSHHEQFLDHRRVLWVDTSRRSSEPDRCHGS